MPILARLGKWMNEQYIQFLHKSVIGKAPTYSIERWNKLSRYIEDGMPNIDNNPAKKSIRPVAKGIKNYLLAGSHEAAKGRAMQCSRIGACKMHSVEPFCLAKKRD